MKTCWPILNGSRKEWKLLVRFSAWHEKRWKHFARFSTCHEKRWKHVDRCWACPEKNTNTCYLSFDVSQKKMKTRCPFLHLSRKKVKICCPILNLLRKRENILLKENILPASHLVTKKDEHILQLSLTFIIWYFMKLSRKQKVAESQMKKEEICWKLEFGSEQRKKTYHVDLERIWIVYLLSPSEAPKKPRMSLSEFGGGASHYSWPCRTLQLDSHEQCPLENQPNDAR